MIKNIFTTFLLLSLTTCLYSQTVNDTSHIDCYEDDVFFAKQFILNQDMEMKIDTFYTIAQNYYYISYMYQKGNIMRYGGFLWSCFGFLKGSEIRKKVAKMYRVNYKDVLILTINRICREEYYSIEE